MTFWVGVAVLVLGLVISIGLHELGHMLPAKRFGVYVPDYAIGFGPTLFSFRRGETRYHVKLLPLGGYVRLVGMFPPKSETSDPGPAARGSWVKNVAADARAQSQADIPAGYEYRAFYRLSAPKKLTVMFGGPVTNLILSGVLFAIVLTGFGAATATAKLGSISECVSATTECAASDPVAPAAAAGLQAGDIITAWGSAPVHEWADVSQAILDGGTAPVAVHILRDGEPKTVEVTAVVTQRPVVADGEVETDAAGDPVTHAVPYVGIGGTFELVPQPLSAVPAVFGQVFTGTAEVVVQLPQRLMSIANSVFNGAERDPGVIGLIGVGRFAGEIASIPSEAYGLKERTADMLSLLASLNMALFMFNMIPLLPLDGGHIAGALYEGGRRQFAKFTGRVRPGFADTAKLMPLTYVVFIGLLAMTVLLGVADIVKPVTLT